MNILSVRQSGKTQSTLAETVGKLRPVLYHASPTQNLKIITPQAKTKRNEIEGPVIFATPDFSYATQFLFRWDDSWVMGGMLNNIHIVVICGKKRFLEADKGGSIYTLPCESFNCDIKNYGFDKEWVSKKEVAVLEENTFENALNAMIHNFVQVYFVDKTKFEKIKKAKDFGVSLLRKTMSENMKLGKNVRFI